MRPQPIRPKGLHCTSKRLTCQKHCKFSLAVLLSLFSFHSCPSKRWINGKIRIENLNSCVRLPTNSQEHLILEAKSCQGIELVRIFRRLASWCGRLLSVGASQKFKRSRFERQIRNWFFERLGFYRGKICGHLRWIFLQSYRVCFYKRNCSKSCISTAFRSIIDKFLLTFSKGIGTFAPSHTVS